MDTPTTWKIIDSFFQSDPRILIKHHLASYDDFTANGISQIFKDYNPMRITPSSEQIEGQHECHLYFGGKDGTRVRFGKPTYIDDAGNSRFLFPNEARLRNLSYSVAVYYDIEIDYIGSFPIFTPGSNPFSVSFS